MNNILMNTEMTKATLDGSKVHTRRVVKDLKAIEKKDIGQNATEDTPAFQMALKGQELLVTEILDYSHWGWKCGYRYSCQDLEKRYSSFYVEEDEIELKSKYKVDETIWVREPVKILRFDDILQQIDYQYLSDGKIVYQADIPKRFKGNNNPKWMKNCQGIPNG